MQSRRRTYRCCRLSSEPKFGEEEEDDLQSTLDLRAESVEDKRYQKNLFRYGHLRHGAARRATPIPYTQAFKDPALLLPGFDTWTLPPPLRDLYNQTIEFPPLIQFCSASSSSSTPPPKLAGPPEGSTALNLKRGRGANQLWRQKGDGSPSPSPSPPLQPRGANRLIYLSTNTISSRLFAPGPRRRCSCGWCRDTRSGSSFNRSSRGLVKKGVWGGNRVDPLHDRRVDVGWGQRDEDEVDFWYNIEFDILWCGGCWEEGDETSWCDEGRWEGGEWVSLHDREVQRDNEWATLVDVALDKWERKRRLWSQALGWDEIEVEHPRSSSTATSRTTGDGLSEAGEGDWEKESVLALSEASTEAWEEL